MRLPSLVLKDIWKSCKGVPVLKGISCTLRAGRGWGILGESGSGKSTLLRLAAGIEIPDRGDIYLGNRMLSKDNRLLVQPSRRRISMVFQDLALWPNLTVLENVIMPGPSTDRTVKKNALDALEICKISGLASRYPSELSGGEQQRLALARALSTRPSFLLLDEPFNGLDIMIKHHIINEIKMLAETNDITVVLVSHDPLEVFSLCSDAIILQDGLIAETGSLESMMAKPVSDTMTAFSEYVRAIRQ